MLPTNFTVISITACFSLQLDESPEIKDATQVIVLIRMVFHDWSIKEEVFGFVSLKGREA